MPERKRSTTSARCSRSSARRRTRMQCASPWRLQASRSSRRTCPSCPRCPCRSTTRPVARCCDSSTRSRTPTTYRTCGPTSTCPTRCSSPSPADPPVADPGLDCVASRSRRADETDYDRNLSRAKAELPTPHGECCEQLLDHTRDVGVQPQVTEADGQIPQRRQRRIAADVLLTLTGLAVVGGSVQLDVDQLVIEEAVELDPTPVAQRHRNLSSGPRQPAVGEDVGMATRFEMTLDAEAQQLEQPTHL